jgi:phage terminase large subunit
LSDQVEALGLSYFYDCQNTVIRGLNGTEFTFEGLHHNVTKIKSYEGADRVWVEEAQAVSKKSWDILIPTIRKDGSEIWMTFNPEFEDDETYQRFVLDPPKSAKVVFINYQDNPFFPAVLSSGRAARCC